MEEIKNRTPKSQLKWQKEYDKLKMSTIAMKMPNKERQEIENAAKNTGLKLSTFCRKCIQYCIDNNITFED
ncbi:MAG: hypothetical protein NC452_05010 [Eubacterium sp.]|nr:hypothetical protein [Eubacterium sp.]